MNSVEWADFEAKCAEYDERCNSDWMEARGGFDYAEDEIWCPADCMP